MTQPEKFRYKTVLFDQGGRVVGGSVNRDPDDPTYGVPSVAVAVDIGVKFNAAVIGVYDTDVGKGDLIPIWGEVTDVMQVVWNRWQQNELPEQQRKD